jgi:hydrogenase maturation protease
LVVPVVADLIAVIGCGNPNRSDDGVGIEVVRQLAPRAGPRLKVLDAGTDGMIVDACVTGAEPGALFEVPAEVVASPHHASYTLHDFRWDHALYAGRRMYGDAFPRDVSVLLVEARTLELGLGLSPEVSAAVPNAVARIERMLDERGA